MKINKKSLFFLTIFLVISLNFFFISCSSQPTYSPHSESEPIEEVTPTLPPQPETETVGAWCYNPSYSGYCSYCSNLQSGADPDVIQGCRLLNDENHCQGCGI